MKEITKKPRCASGYVSFLFPRRTMAGYELNSSVPWPGGYISFVEFSPNGRLLAVGDGDLSSLHILDRCAGFHPLLSTITPAKPTALVWETSKTFYLGQGDGHFTYYQVDLRGKKLVEGVTNRFFQTAIPITAMALDAGCKTLVVSVGPEVFAFRRINAAGAFRLSAYRSGKLILFKADSASSPIYRAGSISKMNLGGRIHSREPYVSLQTTFSLLLFAVGISRESRERTLQAWFNLLF
jgi:hypothetical protein